MPAQWLAEFLAVGQRVQLRTSRAPLFRYRCTEAEFESLRGRLEAALRTALLPSQDRAFFRAFVLYACEWFRRSHVEGPWSWNAILDSLGAAGVHASQIPQVYPQLEDAFAWWNRPLIHYAEQRRFLWSVVRDAGLPVGRLVGDKAHALRQLLGTLAHHAFLYGANALLPIASEHAVRLPLILQDDSILWNLCELARWLAQHRERLLSTSPSLFLQDKEFLEALPFSLDTAFAREVALSLVEESRTVAERVSGGGPIERLTLVRRASDWDLRRSVRLPRKTASNALGLQAPERCRLYLQNSTGQVQPVADCYPLDEQLMGVSAKEYEVTCSRAFTLGSLNLVARVGGREVGRLPFPELSDVPWVFAPHEGDEWRFIGAGSRRSKEPELLVLAPVEFSVVAAAGARTTPEATVMGRRLFRVKGEASFQCNGERCTVISGSEGEDHDTYFLTERPVLGGAFLGVPEVRRIGGFGPPPLLHWRPAGVVTSPTPVEPLTVCRGLGWLSATDSHGAVCFRRQVRLLPTDAQVQPKSQAGAPGLCFVGLGTGAKVRLVDSANVTPQVVPGGVAFFGLPGNPGDTLEFEVSWKDGSALRLQLQHPGQSARFCLMDGSTFAAKSLSVAHLNRVRAEVVTADGKHCQYAVRAQLDHPPAPPGVQVDKLYAMRFDTVLAARQGIHQLDLVALKDEIDLMFASGPAHDTRVRLTIVSIVGPKASARLEVQRYEGVLEVKGDRIALNSVGGSDPALSTVEVCAQPLDAPDAQREVLPRESDGHWRFAHDGRAPGLWLLTGWGAGASRVRPRCVGIGGRSPDAPPVGGLVEAVRAPTPEVRAALLHQLLDRLAVDLTDPEWSRLDAYIRSLRELPPNTYDVVTQLATHPTACAAALLRCAPDERVLLANALEDLPFSWPVVPMSAWVGAVAALRRLRTRKRQLLGEPPLSLSEEQQDYEALCDDLAARLPGQPTIAVALRWACVHLKLVQDPPSPTLHPREAATARWQQLLRATNPEDFRLSAPECPMPWPERFFSPEAQEVLEPDPGVEALSNRLADVFHLNRAPRLACLFALTGAAPRPDQLLALRSARNLGGIQAGYFDDVYAALLAWRLRDESINYWTDP